MAASSAGGGSAGGGSASALSVAYVDDGAAKVVHMVSRYLVGEVLGEGSFGKVREAYDTVSLRRVAIKEVKKRRLKRRFGGNADVGAARVRREIEVMKHLGSHPHAVALYEVLEDEKNAKLYMVLEYVPGGTLRELLAHRRAASKSSSRRRRKRRSRRRPARALDGGLTLFEIQAYLRQLVRGLEYIHRSGVIHRDIKPSNIMVALDGTIKISDFGVAQMLDVYSENDYISSSLGSPAFQPPEVARGVESFSGFKSDVWALGVTLYNMVTGEYPFTGRSHYHLLENIAAGEYRMPTGMDPLLRDVLGGMLEPEPERRYSIFALKHHPFLKLDVSPLSWTLPLDAPHSPPKASESHEATASSTPRSGLPGRARTGSAAAASPRPASGRPHNPAVAVVRNADGPAEGRLAPAARTPDPPSMHRRLARSSRSYSSPALGLAPGGALPGDPDGAGGRGTVSGDRQSQSSSLSDDDDASCSEPAGAAAASTAAGPCLGWPHLYKQQETESSVLPALQVLYEDVTAERDLVLAAGDQQVVMDLFKVNPRVTAVDPHQHNEQTMYTLPMAALRIRTSAGDAASSSMSRSELSSEMSTLHSTFTASFDTEYSWLRSSSSRPRAGERRKYLPPEEDDDVIVATAAAHAAAAQAQAQAQSSKKSRCVVS
ncbi:CAMK/CAMKL/LKB protein kinase [Thecamonas trahens ATCC 50062]|uniref:non-specific serine/threonine protein kinase n=1 Tax=Thecamonas trahens ATCC 50062 TaxID=461836 RepID=A0A0L0DUD0_THETB|nr:CAMK/CAMKL/LKB protein kinase [Thecamonas trahens ATCC 50062]KNC55656.1 CAMK/CAMKL/LKB protein kinase [Thecamonas trahens ATCC 50062]|eukprot:XP_013761425.1 CAMK/CAMKL/LKB protein kinase [Thecamonas trahens ATCC 50062]